VVSILLFDLIFESLRLVGILMKEVFTHQGCIYLINTVKSVIL